MIRFKTEIDFVNSRHPLNRCGPHYQWFIGRSESEDIV